MNAITYYSKAIKKVDEGEITIGEYERMINVLRDVEPVVRCRDCKWYGYYSCEMGGISWMRDGNGFCDRGARMDGDHEKADTVQDNPHFDSVDVRGRVRVIRPDYRF